jgi:hypothetical protein
VSSILTPMTVADATRAVGKLSLLLYFPSSRTVMNCQRGTAAGGNAGTGAARDRVRRRSNPRTPAGTSSPRLMRPTTSPARRHRQLGRRAGTQPEPTARFRAGARST